MQEFTLSNGKKMGINTGLKNTQIYIDGQYYKDLYQEAQASLPQLSFKERYAAIREANKNGTSIDIDGIPVSIVIKASRFPLGGLITDAYENGVLLAGSDSSPDELRNTALGALKFLVGWSVVSTLISFFVGPLSVIYSFVLIWVYLFLFFMVKKLKLWALITAIVVLFLETLLWLVLVFMGHSWTVVYVPLVLFRFSLLGYLIRSIKGFGKGADSPIMMATASPEVVSQPQLPPTTVEPQINQGQIYQSVNASASQTSPEGGVISAGIQNGKSWQAITAISLGALSFPLTMFAPLDIVIAILGIVFGIIGIKSKHRTLAIIGIVLSVIGLLISALLLPTFIKSFTEQWNSLQ